MNNITELENEILDSDIEKLLTVLHQIPEVKIPADFHRRFSNTLKTEGNRIREEKARSSAKARHNRYMKIAVTAAACFVVVFASQSMYNKGIDSLPIQDALKSDNSESVIPAEEYSLSQVDPLDAGVDELTSGRSSEAMADASSDISSDIREDALENNSTNTNTDQQALTMKNSSSASLPAESDGSALREDYFGIQSTEPDLLCREGSKYIETTEEYLNYLKLIAEHMRGYEYECTSCEKDSVSGNYLFEIMVFINQEGQIVNEPLVLVGEQGEIYEHQTEQPADDEPSSSEGKYAGDDTDEEKPQVGSD